jgi:K+-sensing histidine kinase KdpD
VSNPHQYPEHDGVNDDWGPLDLRIAQLERQLACEREIHAQKQAEWEAWISLVSHDLRGPLTLVLGHADSIAHRIRGNPGDERLPRDVRSIMTGAVRMNAMIGQIVDGARLELGRLVVQMEPVEISAVVQEAVRQARRLRPGHPIRVSLGRSLPLVQGDARRLTQLIGSLLSNAIRMSPPGQAVRVSARKIGQRVSISVRDEGIGFAEADLAKVFDKRPREERLRDVGREGLGLSLWIAREVARLHGGDLRAESRGANLGATFTLDLPVDSAPV